MGVVSSWQEMVDLPVGVFEDAMQVMVTESAHLKNERAKARKNEPRARRR
jgi:hypothetical protein